LQIVIPMSGFGERFRRAGYETPKPLIVVDGKPIIHHVVDLFPGHHDFVFICNKTHLQNPEFRMEEILQEIGVRHKIFPIAPHKLGPVHAILSAKELLDPEIETIVNYADFTCLWSFEEFCESVSDPKISGAVPAYRGFHPHSGGNTNYAYIRESNLILEEIREKQPFTDSKTQEFASTGTYYFENARSMLHYLERQVAENINVGGEFYVSSAFDLMAKDGKNVLVYEIEHFMQWGTPQDLAEYEFWSNKLGVLSSLGNASLPIEGTGAALLLASGLGSRFRSKGYKTPKPLLKIAGQTVLEQVRKAVGNEEECLVSSLESSGIARFLDDRNLGRAVVLNELSGGQADSASHLVEQLPASFSGNFTVFPTDTLFADSSRVLQKDFGAEKETVTVWIQSPSVFNKENPESFGWIGVTGESVWTSVKTRPSHSDCFVMSGAFTFSSPTLFKRLYERLRESGVLVNGERYLDSIVQVAIDLGVNVQLFNPTFSISLGTPYEFETYRYWQSCFDRWISHPYCLEKDVFVLEGDIEWVRQELRNTRHKPEEWG
jgi:NDP-sugar pyrophosphorylase family protein